MRKQINGKEWRLSDDVYRRVERGLTLEVWRSYGKWWSFSIRDHENDIVGMGCEGGMVAAIDDCEKTLVRVLARR
jgi:hypothetical protein